MLLVVNSTGTIRCLYDEQFDLATLGSLVIQRASHVEPTSEGLWQADLSPVGGPILEPCHTRSQALQAEVRWLEQHWLQSPTDASLPTSAEAPNRSPTPPSA